MGLGDWVPYGESTTNPIGGSLYWGMTDEHADPVVVGRYPTEFEASLARNMLVEAGIPSQVVGAMTAGFRAETPGMVDVLVPGAYEEEARELIEEFAEQASGDDDGHDDDFEDDE